MTGRVSPNILYEDLCYDAQQAVEKETSVNIMPRALYQKKEAEDLLQAVREFKVEVIRWLKKNHPLMA